MCVAVEGRWGEDRTYSEPWTAAEMRIMMRESENEKAKQRTSKSLQTKGLVFRSCEDSQSTWDVSYLLLWNFRTPETESSKLHREKRQARYTRKQRSTAAPGVGKWADIPSDF